MTNKNSIAASRWYRLIPVIFVTYSLAYLDRANFGFGAAGGMAKDLHISSNMSSLLGSLFFLGYFFFQIPGTIYASNKSAKKLIFWSLIFWGLAAMATGSINNVKILLVIRFMLGVFESAVFPSMLVLISRWFTREERSRANTLTDVWQPGNHTLDVYYIRIFGSFARLEMDVYLGRISSDCMGFLLVEIGKRQAWRG